MSGSPQRESRRRRGERGTVLVEFSLVFVLFAFICYALVAFGLAMNLKSNLTHAASEGARAAVGAGGDCVPDPMTTCRTAKEAATRLRVNEAVSGQSQEVKDEVAALMTDSANAHVDYCEGSSGPYCMLVTLPFDYAAHPIVPSAPGLGVIMPDTLTAVATVQLTN